MTIVTVQFDSSKYKPFDTLLRVFRQSVREHMPDVRWNEIRLKKPDLVSGKAMHLTNNTVKLEAWVKYMDTADDDTIFADCDMLALQPAYHAFDLDFDIGATFRPDGSRPPMNGGIVFARPTDGARSFMRRWLDINNRMYANRVFHHEWIRYLGMNQCAFGYLWETGRHGAKIQRFPTRIWNAVDLDWKSISDKTVFVHFKSQLRRAVLHNYEPYAEFTRPMRAWFDTLDRLPAPPLMPPQESKAITYRKTRRRGRAG